MVETRVTCAGSLWPGRQPDEAAFQPPSKEATLSSTLKLYFIRSFPTWLLLAVGYFLLPTPHEGLTVDSLPRKTICHVVAAWPLCAR